jgi:penicillin amidase
MSFLRLARAAFLALIPLLTLAPVASGQSDTVRIAGLERPVEIVIDRWGIPHIYAQTERDLFFAQGYNAARDRLFQLELWRRQTTGTLSEVLGPRTVKKDVGARLLKYRGDMRQELTRYHDRGPEIFDAFVQGINAYIEQTERDPDLLPMEFEVLGIRPGRWTVDVVANRLNGLFRNVTSEVRNAQLLQVMDAEMLESLSVFYGDPDLSANGVDLALIDDDIVELYREARAPVEFRPEDVQTSYRSEEAVRRLAAALPREAPVEEDWMDLGYGSNNWVVSGRFTMSGSPMLANDPHRAISIPPLRYVVHLVGPGWNVIGSGEPTVPGVSMGHNEHGAYGLTIHGMDMEDLYVYDTDPSDPNRYRYQGGWEEMRVVREEIPVKGQAAERVELKFTRHGPVLYEDRENRKAYALRAAWLEPGAAPYVGQMRYAQARNWEEFRRGVQSHLAPAHNVVWADVHGDIGWQVGGIAPVRDGWSGLLPVPGDGRFEWDGYLPISELPHKHNPPEGFIATANEHNVPPDYDGPVYSYEFSDPYRSARIHELLLSGRRRLTVADMNDIHQDVLSLPARNLVPLLEGLKASDPTAERARAMLLDWDFRLEKDSAPAAVYVAWERRLEDRLAELFVPTAARDLMRGVSTIRMVQWLTAPDGHFGEDPTGGRDALLLSALQEAVGDLSRRLGPDPQGWRYGQYKHIEVRHALSEVVRPELREGMDVGPAPRGGTGYTVNPTGGGDNQTSGPSYRIIADTGDWDNSVGITTPGQSGDPASPHYDDLFETYVNGKYVPFFFSRPKVDSVRERTLLLTPRP